MRMFKFTTAAACIALLFSSCETESPNQINLTGTIIGEEGPLIFSYIDAVKGAPVPMDTMEVVDGKFSFSWESDSINFYTINTSKGYYIPVLIESGEAINIDITGQDVDRKYTVTGSAGSQRILDINDVSVYAMTRVDSLNNIADQFKDSANYSRVKIVLDETFQKILNQASSGMKKFIDEDPSDLTNLLIFSQTVARANLINPQTDFDYFEKVAKGLEEKYPNNQHTKFFTKVYEQSKVQAEQEKKKMEVQATLIPGSQIPEISLPSPEGEFRSLSDLKGKVVLVDFWAAWCGPCRKENPNLVRLYNEFKGKGFEVFSVSLDGTPQQPNPKADWTRAIQADGLVWDNHVSDLLGWGSTVVGRFGIRGIPYTILIDREGKIIQTNVQGPALEAKLKELFGS